ncbi:MAG TPA: SDR family NAD(P)-dependent oxidoreductase [Bryobacteraceae bacterium]|nr:short-chain dehydrogenase [Bryobacterales bacterium]HRJ18237.1 SDR family NAD(P)-dependent oxidoreductase [Bryobacteraceae bacterium]
MPELFELSGKRALITGGASGIGEATARLFAGAGAEVVIADLDDHRASAVAASLPGARALHVDLTSEASVQAAFALLDRLDVLVNNAGIGLVGSIEETAAEDFDRLMAVNVRGVYLATRAAVPLLRAAGGNIVNIGSVAGLVAVKRRFAYCATKGAVVAMTRQLAIEYAGEIRVNCICPGTVDTPFVEAYLEKYHKHEKEEVRRQLDARQPVGRLGRPEEIAALALYLASGQAGFVTGSIMTIDGGWTAA